MTIIAFIAKRIALFKKCREAAAIREHLFVLRDQRDSAIAGIKRYQAKLDRVEAQIGLLEDPDEIVRRSGAGA